MKVFNAEFLASAKSLEHFPKIDLPEFSFAGRSNVGKSSLLNTLTLRKNLAYVSSKPGKTQQINFYNIEGKYIFADMPGYGFANVSKQEREAWKTLCTNYFRIRGNLVLVLLLVDVRLEPQKIDLAQIELLENFHRDYVIVFTKSDKVSDETLIKRIKTFEFLLQYCNFLVELLPFSSQTKRGREELLGIIRKFAEKWKTKKEA
ncbi:MAG: ribosome biogenesis GTP-binding protein YihA/YsxC [Candidatus Kapaibacteriota bacterium]